MMQQLFPRAPRRTRCCTKSTPTDTTVATVLGDEARMVATHMADFVQAPSPQSLKIFLTAMAEVNTQHTWYKTYLRNLNQHNHSAAAKLYRTLISKDRGEIIAALMQFQVCNLAKDNPNVLNWPSNLPHFIQVLPILE